jgi:hypothetical protein
MKIGFNEKALAQKYHLFRQKHDEVKKKHKVSRHLLRGETGAASKGQPTNVQEAIDKATGEWPLLSESHASFGSLQRLREDTYQESISSGKPKPTTGKEPVAPSQSMCAAAAKRPRTTRSGSPEDSPYTPGDDPEEDRKTASPESDCATSKPSLVGTSAGRKSADDGVSHTLYLSGHGCRCLVDLLGPAEKLLAPHMCAIPLFDLLLRKSIMDVSHGSCRRQFVSPEEIYGWPRL